MSETFVVATDLLAGKFSSWSNLGYWQDVVTTNQHNTIVAQVQDYETACKNLALWVGQLAQVDQDQAILDLCVGRGGSVLYWLQDAGVRHVDAIELSSNSLATLDEASPTGLGFAVAADIADPTLSKKIRAGSYDAVICLDAFYHLKDPAALWRLAAHALKPGGHLGFCTLLTQQELALPTALRIFLASARVQGSTLFNPKSLAQQLQAHGFMAPAIQWGTSAVLAGFANFVAARASALAWHQRLDLNWLKITATASLARAILRDGSLGYAAIAARRC